MTQLSQCQSINEMKKINKEGKVAAHRHSTKTMHSYTSIASCDNDQKVSIITISLGVLAPHPCVKFHPPFISYDSVLFEHKSLTVPIY